MADIAPVRQPRQFGVREAIMAALGCLTVVVAFGLVTIAFVPRKAQPAAPVLYVSTSNPKEPTREVFVAPAPRPVTEVTRTTGGSLPQSEIVREPIPAPQVEAREPVPVKPVARGPEFNGELPLKKDARGFTSHSLAKRLDLRGDDDLQKELVRVPEVSLATPKAPKASQELVTAATQAKNQNKTFAGTMVATKGRPDLAALPFRAGSDTILFRDKSSNMNEMSLQLRAIISANVQNRPPGANPDSEQLYTQLISTRGGFNGNGARKWNAPEAVPCIQQMLQAESSEVRRMSCELLKSIDGNDATEALVRWAIFDTNANNRAAAVAALRDRDPALVGKLLLEGTRYPWLRAVEHACEALVELGLKDTIPQLAVNLELTNPDAPFLVELPGSKPLYYRQEMARVNHARNCVMCHPVSFNSTDLIRGAVPDPNRPLPPPSTPAYYNSGNPNTLQVTATTTYLKQDFSVVQPVPNPGLWPMHQRYDYFISTVPVQEDVNIKADPSALDPYKTAIRFAIRGLAGDENAQNPDWLMVQRERAPKVRDRRLTAAAQTIALNNTPEAFLALKMAEFTKPLLSLSRRGMATMIQSLQVQNPVALKVTLLAYLEPLLDDLGPAEREKAARIVQLALNPDLEYVTFLAAIASEN